VFTDVTHRSQSLQNKISHTANVLAKRFPGTSIHAAERTRKSLRKKEQRKRSAQNKKRIEMKKAAKLLQNILLRKDELHKIIPINASLKSYKLRSKIKLDLDSVVFKGLKLRPKLLAIDCFTDQAREKFEQSLSILCHSSKLHDDSTCEEDSDKGDRDMDDKDESDNTSDTDMDDIDKTGDRDMDDKSHNATLQ